MPIHLTPAQIDAALPKVAIGLQQYLWLQSRLQAENALSDPEFRRRFNHFYRVRRGPSWQNAFYDIMSLAKREHLSFDVVLGLLAQETGRYEASFTSKLIATLDPHKPVIDSVVLKNLGLRLPAARSAARADKLRELYAKIQSLFLAYLQSEDGSYLASAFCRAYPEAHVSDEKKIDLVLWQTRG